jgi:hypothetical protein
MLGTHWEQQNPKGSTTPTTTAPFKIKKMGSIGPLGACSTPHWLRIISIPNYVHHMF